MPFLQFSIHSSTPFLTYSESVVRLTTRDSVNVSRLTIAAVSSILLFVVSTAHRKFPS